MFAKYLFSYSAALHFPLSAFTNGTSYEGLTLQLWPLFHRLWRNGRLWQEAAMLRSQRVLWPAVQIWAELLAVWGCGVGWCSPCFLPKAGLPHGMDSLMLLALPGRGLFWNTFPCGGFCTLGFLREHGKAEILVCKVFPCFLRCIVPLTFSCE